MSVSTTVASPDEVAAATWGNKYHLIGIGSDRTTLTTLTLAESWALKEDIGLVTPKRLARYALMCKLVELDTTPPDAITSMCAYAVRADETADNPGDSPAIVRGIGRGLCLETIELLCDATVARQAVDRQEFTTGDTWCVMSLFMSCKRLAGVMLRDQLFNDAVALCNALCIHLHVESILDKQDIPPFDDIKHAGGTSDAKQLSADARKLCADTDPTGACSWEAAHSYMRYFIAYIPTVPHMACVHTDLGKQLGKSMLRIAIRDAMGRARSMCVTMQYASALWIYERVLGTVPGSVPYAKACSRVMTSIGVRRMADDIKLNIVYQLTPWISATECDHVVSHAPPGIDQAFRACKLWCPNGVRAPDRIDVCKFVGSVCCGTRK